MSKERISEDELRAFLEALGEAIERNGGIERERLQLAITGGRTHKTVEDGMDNIAETFLASLYGLEVLARFLGR